MTLIAVLQRVEDLEAYLRLQGRQAELVSVQERRLRLRPVSDSARWHIVSMLGVVIRTQSTAAEAVEVAPRYQARFGRGQRFGDVVHPVVEIDVTTTPKHSQPRLMVVLTQFVFDDVTRTPDRAPADGAPDRVQPWSVSRALRLMRLREIGQRDPRPGVVSLT